MDRLNYDVEMFLQKIKDKNQNNSEHTRKDLLELKCQILVLRGQNKEEQRLIRRFFEICVIHSLEINQLEEFEKNAKRVIEIYQEFDLERSENEIQINSLYLLHLLVNNKTSEFHCHLEHLSQEDLEQPMIKTVLNLEQYILQGNYKEFVQQKQTKNYQYFEIFVNHFQNTIRNEMCKSIELSYRSLKYSAIIQMMNFNNIIDLKKFIQSLKSNNIDSQNIMWKFDDSQQILHFTNKNQIDQQYDSQNVIKTMIQFTNAIEKVV